MRNCLIVDPVNLSLQMLTSKDNNFMGFTFKKSDVLKSLESSGMLLRIFIISVPPVSGAETASDAFAEKNQFS